MAKPAIRKFRIHNQIAMSQTAEQNIQEKNSNFYKWLLSTNQLKEKIVSFAVLFFELLLLMTHNIQKLSIPLIQALNLIFLLYFIYDLKNHFKLEFKVKSAENETPLAAINNGHHDLIRLQERANRSIKQFRNVGGFLLSTAILYLLLIFSNLEKQYYLSFTDGKTFTRLQSLIEFIFNIAIHFLSYAGALYILKCFYVMQFPSFFKTNDFESKLETNTSFFWFFIGGFLIAELFLTFPMGLGINYKLATFYFEFFCGIVNAIVMMMLFARFESRLLGINPFIILLLYVYAILQTSLPLITENNLLLPYSQNNNTGHNTENSNSAFLVTLILSICLLGKIIFYNIIVYLYQTKRLFYYFLITKLNFDKEDTNWGNFERHSEMN